MINLLPPEQKEELRQEENFKIILILGILCFSLLVSSALILFSIKTSILGMLEVQKIYLEEKEKELKSAEIQELEEKIKELNQSLLKLDSFYQEEIGLAGILEKFSKTLPKNTYLTNINFNSVSSQFSLSGFCPNRETLLQFKKNLEKEEKLKEVYFPPTNWVSPTDINFSITFKIN